MNESTIGDAGRLAGRVQTAGRLAPLGAPAASAALPARAWSRVRALGALLFTARQRRFNIEAAAALDGLCSEVAGLRVEVAAARAELADLKADLEPPHFRPGTLDAAIWEDVNRRNEYALPEAFGPADVVLDIGGHIGSFAFACLRRGAGAAVSYEPHPDNAALAALNLARFGRRAEVMRAAVWRSDEPPGVMHLERSLDPTNTGGAVVTPAAGLEVPTVPFDAAVEDAVARFGVRRVRLVKLDCEGSEYPILTTSRALHLVEAIAGEYHEAADPIPGHDRHALRRHLEGQGFRVEHRQHTPNPHIGLFFATRAA